jgi:hypothetical protein
VASLRLISTGTPTTDETGGIPYYLEMCPQVGGAARPNSSSFSPLFVLDHCDHSQDVNDLGSLTKLCSSPSLLF